MATASKTATATAVALMSLGRNINAHMDGDNLHIIVPLSADVIANAPLSGSGKSRSVATTNGNVGIPGTSVKLGLNIYAPQPKG